MDNFTLFICGLVVTLIAGMGIITSEVFLGYERFMRKNKSKQLKLFQNDEIKTKAVPKRKVGVKLNRRNLRRFVE